MATDEEKIAALKAIRDKARAAKQNMEEDGTFAVLDEELYKKVPVHQYDEKNFDHSQNHVSESIYEDFAPQDGFVEDIPHENDIESISENLNPEEENFDSESEEYHLTEEDFCREMPVTKTDIEENNAEDAVSGIFEENETSCPWHAVYQDKEHELPILNIEFNGKNLENGEFDHEDLSNANFSVANLSGVDFSGSDLRGADFSGANLTNTNLSGTDLTGAILSGAQLVGTNFTGAIMKNVVLTDVYFENAILIDTVMDDITLEEFQGLIEYLAQYYPHKLNLSRINLTLLDLSKIDLSRVNLRGVDFTGVDFTGINIAELDLSECIITPEQIAQALGRVPTPIELQKILAPKPKDKKKSGKGIDFTDLFLGDARNFGIYNVSGFKGIDIGNIVKIGKKVCGNKKEKAPVRDEEALEYVRQQNQKNKDALRHVIEERKRRVLENKRRQKSIISPEQNHYQR